MFNFLKKKNKTKESYSIVFCDANDVNTMFNTYNTYDTYDTADHVIRMTWRFKKYQKVNDGYQLNNDTWILIKENKG